MGLDRDLLRRVRALDEHGLRRLMVFAGGLLAARAGRVEPLASLSWEGPVRTADVTYRRQWVRCGKATCGRCPHGPYWYAYWREGGRVRSRYVGKRLPPPSGQVGGGRSSAGQDPGRSPAPGGAGHPRRPGPSPGRPPAGRDRD